MLCFPACHKQQRAEGKKPVTWTPVWRILDLTEHIPVHCGIALTL